MGPHRNNFPNTMYRGKVTNAKYVPADMADQLVNAINRTVQN